MKDKMKDIMKDTKDSMEILMGRKKKRSLGIMSAIEKKM